MSMNVQPDLDFIKAMKEAGGDTLKKCYQCATCSVACPLSSDDKPFPRKEMLLAQWGMKDKLTSDPNVYLCHQCNDCSELCPRGARPGDVLGAIRAYAYRALGWPKCLADLCSSEKNLPMLIGIPAVVTLIMWIISGGVPIPSPEAFERYGYTQFFGHWNFPYLSKNVVFIDIIMLTCVVIACISFYKGLTKMWRGMRESVGLDGSVAYRPSCVQFVQMFLWPSIVEIIQHTRFKECKENYERVKGHLPLVLGFIGLFVVTVISVVKQDVLGIFIPELHGPFSMLNPVKWLANIAAIAMIYGIGVLWINRKKKEDAGKSNNTFYDWFLIWIIMGVGVTGLGAEVLRLMGIASLGYVVYYLHLVSVAMLFLYLPYTKLAHIIYRTFAMAFERYRNSVFVKNPLND